MAKRSIYDRQSGLRPAQLVAVAERRFADAQALVATGQNERANGAQYLGGYVVEILLKARLLRHPALRDRHHPDHAKLQRAVYQKHDLELLLSVLNAWRRLDQVLTAHGARAGVDYLAMLKQVCAAWTVHARYSTQSSTIAEARALLDAVRRL